MNLKDAFRVQNKLQSVMLQAMDILEDRQNILKVRTTHLRSKVMADNPDVVVEENASSEYAGHANEIVGFLMEMMGMFLILLSMFFRNPLAKSTGWRALR